LWGFEVSVCLCHQTRAGELSSNKREARRSKETRRDATYSANPASDSDDQDDEQDLQHQTIGEADTSQDSPPKERCCVSTVGSNRGEREENVSECEGEDGGEEAGFGEAARFGRSAVGSGSKLKSEGTDLGQIISRKRGRVRGCG